MSTKQSTKHPETFKTKNLNPPKLQLNSQIKNEIKLKLLNCLQRTTSHGLPNISRTHNLAIRLLWITCTLISAGLCAFMIISSVNEYFEYDVVTKIRVIDQVPLEFPTITICSLNPFESEFASEIFRNITLDEHKFDLNSNASLSSFPRFFNWLFITHLKALRDAYNPSFGDKNRKALGFDLEKSLFYCSFNYISCSHSNF